MTEAGPEDEGGGQSFWTTLPGILTGVAALVSAIVAATSLFVLGEDEADKPASVTAASTQVSTSGAGSSGSSGGGGTRSPGSGTGGGRSEEGAPAPGGFRVTNVALQVDPALGSVTCPATVRFRAEITAEGTGTVSYRWVGAGADETVQAVSFDGGGQTAVESELALESGSASGERTVEIVGAASPGFEPARFDVSCA